MVQQQRDVLQIVHIRLRHRVVAALDVAVISREVQRRPTTFIGEVRVRAVLEQVRTELVVSVVAGHEQRRPAVLGDLVHIGARFDQYFGRVETAFPRRKYQRREAAASPSDKTGDDDVLIGVVHRVFRGPGGRRRLTKLRRGRAHPGLEVGRLCPIQAKATHNIGQRRSTRSHERDGLRNSIVRNSTVRLLERQLILVASSRSLRVAASLRGGFDSFDGYRRGHVISGETRRTCLGAGVRSKLDEHLRGGRVALLRGPHQRRGRAQALFGVHVGAGCHEYFDRLRVAVARGEHHRRFAVGSALFRIGPCLE